MKKIFPLLLAIALFTGCSAKITQPEHIASNVEKSFGDAVEVVASLDTGFLYILLSIEANSNISSLVFDKTKEKVTSFYIKSYETVPEGKSLYVLPAKITRNSKTYYDEETGRMVRNYLHLTGLGKTTAYVQNADYFVTTSIKESLDRSFDSNTSTVVLSILDKNDLPLFTGVIKLESKADINFWYYPTKEAIPADTLTMKGMAQIFAVALPKAFGVPTSRWEKMEKAMRERSNEKRAMAKAEEEQEIIAEQEDVRDEIKRKKEFEEYLRSIENQTEETGG
jgi:hypothetical protein